MSSHVKFPPLPPTQRQSSLYENSPQSNDVQMAARGQEGESSVSGKPFATKKLWYPRGDYLYAGPAVKPRFLKLLESYLNQELQDISPREPKFQELKLQVYRNVFGRFIKEFRTYQPLLSLIQKEYDNTIAYQQDQMELLRSSLRLVTEECDRKIRACSNEKQAEMVALKRENQHLQRDLEVMREQEKNMQTEVGRLQLELCQQYLQYLEECEAHKSLIVKFNNLTKCSVKEKECADEDAEQHTADPMLLQLALSVCREDLTKAQMELNRFQAEYLDVVPRRDLDALERTHKQTLLQLERLQRDFDQLKREHDTLLELHKRDGIAAESHCSNTVQIDESVHFGQNQLQCNLLKVLIKSDASESGTLTVQEFRATLQTAFPLKSDEALNELVASAQRELDSNNNTITYQRLYSLGADGKNGEFLSLVKRQSLEERQLCIGQLRAQLGDKGEVSVSDLRAVLMCINPDLDPDTLDRTLSLAFQLCLPHR
ncbi:translin-associated factor X-interacting protein 1 isoform X2 [Myripristis murdjan]|uniref:translin-associated factor X-interacting protein 1 isoform X2 n=1 Tax=Myripristis murdjan TaxID=586833 RepID=UPI0011761885|nr:translin-associated factor X-interacting protein 1 isoform X2 [Myripristis murdjan]